MFKRPDKNPRRRRFIEHYKPHFVALDCIERFTRFMGYFSKDGNEKFYK